MIKHGKPPFLECSSKGDKLLSAFYARIKSRGSRSIEDIYQSAKILEDGRTNLSWREAKGKKAVNQDEVQLLYSELWNQYVEENPILKERLRSASGLSDVFGSPGSVCQATELWRIRNELLLRDQNNCLVAQNTNVDAVLLSPRYTQNLVKHYELNCRQYVLMDGDKPIGKVHDTLSFCINKDDGYLQKFGDPEKVKTWYLNETAKLRISGANEFSEAFVVITGRFPLDEINKLIANPNCAGEFYQKLVTGCIQELPLFEENSKQISLFDDVEIEKNGHSQSRRNSI